MPRIHPVRRLRETRGLTQVSLARQVGLTRQTVSAIEAGRSIPAVDIALRIAAALDSRVEELFGDANELAPLEPDGGVGSITGRVSVANIGGRWVALPLSGDGLRISADGLASPRKGRRALVRPVRALAELHDNVVLMGCAGALGLLADRLNARRGAGRFLWFPTGSVAALAALTAGRTHIAGVHLIDPETGEANVSDARNARSREPLVLVTLAHWQAGLLVRPEDRRRIRSASDLARRRLRLAVREEGSGARRLLERELLAAGMATALERGRSIAATSHLEVARLIALGAADVGVATQDAALVLGLHFVPLAHERVDLVIPRALLVDPRVERLLDVLGSAAVRSELGSLGYDVAHAGARVAEVSAA